MDLTLKIISVDFTIEDIFCGFYSQRSFLRTRQSKIISVSLTVKDNFYEFDSQR